MSAARFELQHCRDATDVARTAAGQWLAELTNRTSTQTRYTVALSGGRITEQFFREVVMQAGAGSAAFANVHFHWADERCVPPAHEQSNFKIAHETLLQPLGIAAAQIYRLRGENEPLAAAQTAETDLRRGCEGTKDGQPVLDMVFLGMGEDGHVASLFPHEPEAMMEDAAVYRAVFDSPKPPPQRLTLGYRTIAAAREVWVLVSGEAKKAALKASVEPGGMTDGGTSRMPRTLGTPLGRVLAMRSQTRLFTDIEI